MFEFLFKYPATVFSKGQFVLLSALPAWTLALAILAIAAGLAWHVRRRRGFLTGARPVAIWLLETALAALMLFLLWHPAISIATLRPQQNIVSVLIDDSRSMSIREDGKTRLEQATGGLNSGVLEGLRKRFQVRLYRFGKDAERIDKLEQVTGAARASRIGDGILQTLADSSTLPLGAVVLLSDGADNSGGVDRETIGQIRQRQIPIHTVGFGKEKLDRDVEISDVSLPSRTLADARLAAQVSFRQFGYSGQKAKLSVRDGGKVLASQDVTLKGDGAPQSEQLQFNAGIAGAKSYQFSVEPLPGEENTANNAVTRMVNVEASKPRILYIEGEPRWEFKFIRRAVEDDRSLQLVTILRTTQNKIYVQGAVDKKELEDGFPAQAEKLFGFSGLIIGDVEANYFSAAQQELIREFANRRGGGVLFLGGRATLSDGGYPHSPLAELLPVKLLERKDTFHRDPAAFELSALGRESVICRLEEKPERNVERWKKMPVLADFQEVGEAKPGAVVLAELNAPGKKKSPLLVTENYGRGRTALFATSGSWRWQMMQDHTDRTHEMFWGQLLRWLVTDTPGRVLTSLPKTVFADETKIPLRAEVRDKSFKLMSNVRVEARIVGPEGIAAAVEMNPAPLEEGVYTADWTAEKPGSYVAEVIVKPAEGSKPDSEDLGRDVVMFRREDGVAESFRSAQNRELLEKLAEQTGGRYYTARDMNKLADQISYSEAGITTRETRDIWDMPVIFLFALSLRAMEWMLRRKWGVV
ncbi:MAG TPA: glutamine amidotransferase [Bryobacteraceae bacterium]|jgi:uncharacterized membrane protein|nr:glutamine amidotransferase [Bryobacteraceae bacterium]